DHQRPREGVAAEPRRARGAEDARRQGARLLAREPRYHQAGRYFDGRHDAVDANRGAHMKTLGQLEAEYQAAALEVQNIQAQLSQRKPIGHIDDGEFRAYQIWHGKAVAALR